MDLNTPRACRCCAGFARQAAAAVDLLLQQVGCPCFTYVLWHGMAWYAEWRGCLTRCWHAMQCHAMASYTMHTAVMPCHAWPGLLPWCPRHAMP